MTRNGSLLGFALLCSTALASSACDRNNAGGRDGGPDDQPGSDAAPIDFDRTALLTHLGQDIVLPAVQSFDGKADALVPAVNGWCASLGTAGEAAALTTAQDAWRATASAWQLLRTMSFGPLAMDQGVLSDNIDSWPVTSGCAVDGDVMLRRNNPAGYDLSTKVANRRGLPAAEYLLFHTDLASVCASAPTGWNALSDTDKRAARCGFAQAVAVDLAKQTQTLASAWSPSGGDYVGVLANAGKAGSPFASAQAALNAISDRLFYIDSTTKDMKLAEVAGIMLNSCGTVGSACLAELEMPWSDYGKESVVANLQGLQQLFSGDAGASTGGLGFDDMLAAVNGGELAATMQADIAAAIAATQAIPTNLGVAVVSSRPSVVEAHVATKKITDNLKSQFLTLLGLEIPDDVAADND